MTADRSDARELIDFIDAAPSPFHACAETAVRLEAAGFRRLIEADAWPTDPGRSYIQRGGSIVAWTVGPAHTSTTGFRIVGAHTDSPNLRVKPQPDTGKAGWRQLAVEVYGGVLLNSWLDRDLGLSGRVVLRAANGIEERLLKVDRPLLRVPQLAIHLDREIYEKGLLLNAQSHMAPVWGLGQTDAGGFARFLAEEVGAEVADILAWEVMAHDLTPGTILGRDDELIASARLDNLCSSYAGLQALLAASDRDAPAISMLCLFDHEEVGSTSAQGAGSSILEAVIERVVAGLGGGPEERLRALAASSCASADMAHATHPSYAERHEPGHHIAVNGGPVIKINANLRYATDSATAGRFELACRDAGVPVQRYVNRTDLPCGSTIGPITAARLGISTVDVGVAQLSMHSARELSGAEDPAHYRAALTSWLLQP
jgi:aspartyl aminopeptidase